MRGSRPAVIVYRDTMDSALCFTNSLIDDINRDFFTADRYQYIIDGLKVTIEVTLIGLLIGLLLGVIFGAITSLHQINGKLKIPNVICNFYITVIRGTPTTIQLLIIYFVVFASIALNQVIIAGIAFGLNSAAYIAEIMRAGIGSVPKGQFEASYSLGLSTDVTMTSVVLPQAFRNILPALCNEGITLLKETSICGYIGLMDLTRAGNIIRAQTFDAFLPLFAVALIYLIIVLILSYLVKRLERRLGANAI